MSETPHQPSTLQTTPPQPTPLQAITPNLLTGLRLVLTVAFIAVLAIYDWTPFAQDLLLSERLRMAILQPDLNRPLLIAAILFIVAAITDALDGYLARKWNAVSVFGRVMDPFADKLLVLGAFVMLAGSAFRYPESDLPNPVTGVESWMVVVILGRELLITSLRGALESRGVDFSASWSGKLKMILQSAAVPLVLVTIALYAPFEGTNARLIVQWTAWLTVAVTALSGVPYIVRAARHFAAGSEAPKP